MAVLREIKRKYPRAEVRFWCDKKFARQAVEIMKGLNINIPVQTIFAGKFRRYHHISAMHHLLLPSLVIHNLKDTFLAGIGFFQSIIKLVIWRPDVVFTKGGYVCLPVGIATHLLGIPIVIHDSDVHPGLTNRILSRWASAIATGAPLEYYSYPVDRSRYVGIPISPEFHEFSNQELISAREKWGIDKTRQLIVVTGGGLGARRINDVIALSLDDLLLLGSVVLISGNLQYDELRSIVPQNGENFQLHPFISKDMVSLMGAANVVIARAGATTILELATLAKPTILIPNSKLSGGHQLKNAEVYRKKGAVIVIDEEKMVENPQILVSAISDMLNDPKRADEMAHKLLSFARPNAAIDVADMIISNIK